MKKIIISESQMHGLNEYLDKEYMLPLWKNLHMTEKEKYLEWICEDEDNLHNFLGFMFDELNDEITDGYTEVRRKFKNKFLKDAYDRGLYNDQVIKYLWKNYDRLEPYIKEYFQIRLFRSKHYDTHSWNSNLIFQNPTLMQNIWVMHFGHITGNDVGRDKSMMNRLAYTYMKHKEERSEESIKSGGYSFGYDASDIINRSLRDCLDTLAYGDYINMFRCNAIKIYHPTDRENQVIYNPKSVDKRSKVTLKIETNEERGYYSENDNWIRNENCDMIVTVYDWNTKPIYRTKSLPKAIQWVMDNFEQYHSTLNAYSTSKVAQLRQKINTDWDNWWNESQTNQEKGEKHVRSYEQRDFLENQRIYNELPQEVKDELSVYKINTITPQNYLKCMKYAAEIIRIRLPLHPEWKELYDKVKYYDPVKENDE